MKSKLRHYRKRRGLTLEAVASTLDLSPSQISRLERGTSDLTGERLQQFAHLYQTTPAELIGGLGRNTPLVGYIGAGAAVYPFDDALPGGGLDEVDTPPGESVTLVAVEVRGESMLPAYREGDLIYYARDGAFDERRCLGSECVVTLRDGRTLVKTLIRGNHPGTFTLLSYNASPIENVMIEWAAPVHWVDKRRRHRL